MAKKTRILFICTGNACRSQMAEGWARHLKGGAIEPYSAGVIATRLDPLAVEVMAEAGVDISEQSSKQVGRLVDMYFDYVVTLCDEARQSCPVFPGNARMRHRGFLDPPSWTLGLSLEDKLDVYRRVRDEIRAFVESLPEALED